MKLLFDENLSPKLVERLEEEVPGSLHVESTGPRGQADVHVWEYAARQGFTIVSKDNDFRQLSFLRGPPPKVIWLSVGNAGTEAIADLLLSRLSVVRSFQSNAEESLLVLELGGGSGP